MTALSAALRSAFVLVALLVLATAVHAAPTFPALTGRVVDAANIIPPAEEAALTAKLAALEEKTTDQLVVVTLPSLQGYDIADYGYQLGRAWGIGQKGKNNGLLLIVAPNDRAVRIEVGYGLEGEITDAISSVIINNAILPRFRANDMAGGISRGVDDLVQFLSGDTAAIKQQAEQRPEPEPEKGWISPFLIILIIWIVIIMFRHMARGGRRTGWFIPGPTWTGGSSSSGWGGGGSFGGGGFSGGGGSFGGGGASGRW